MVIELSGVFILKENYYSMLRFSEGSCESPPVNSLEVDLGMIKCDIIHKFDLHQQNMTT